MCGIFGFVHSYPQDKRQAVLHAMRDSLVHRGPDGEGWLFVDEASLGHVRLSIIDTTETGRQPMEDELSVITYNGEIYNYIELRKELSEFTFRTQSDTEVILKAYQKWGSSCVEHLRGMFAFALWDKQKKSLFLARDRFGIKPLYYYQSPRGFFFASEAKALLPVMDKVAVNPAALKDYLSFQFPLGDKTLFDGVKQLSPATWVYVIRGEMAHPYKYWSVSYQHDWAHSELYFIERLRELVSDSVHVHLRSDVPLGSYLSGGIDSSIVSMLAKQQYPGLTSFTGRFLEGPEYDESRYAEAVAKKAGISPHYFIDITQQDFIDNIMDIVKVMDYPVAGPGVFPQYMVSKFAAQKVKVVLGGQGGDEIFGGYVRYLISYFEQCIKGAIEGTLDSGNFVVTYESIIPQLRALENYKPLLREFWSSGLFDSPDKRYYRLVNRANKFGDEINWEFFRGYSSFDEFSQIFHSVPTKSHFDMITHFDFTTLLPSLLHVEDRMSMAHGLESRVPFLDHRIVELANSCPADVKFKDGKLKRLLKETFGGLLPSEVVNRKDKQGFPVPLNKWMQKGTFREFILDSFKTVSSRTRPYLGKSFNIEKLVGTEGSFDRRLWGLLSLELWYQTFIDGGVS